jgi:uncharacterized protein (TIGR00266 family)
LNANKSWYMAIGGHQVGPVSEAEIGANLRNGSIDSSTLLFGPGLVDWKPLRDIPLFAALAHGLAQPAGSHPPKPPNRRAHEIDFEIHGEELQFIEVQLDPGESAIAEAGALMYMTQGVRMETIFGDGSEASRTSGLFGSLLSAGKRLLTGESLFMTVFHNGAQRVERVAFAAPYAGRIQALDLALLGGEVLCQRDSFLCAARGVSIGIAFQKRIGAGLFGGEGFIMQRLQGDGLCFVHAGGTIHAVELAPGEELRVDTGCLVALQPSVEYDIQFVGGIKSAIFGGEGLFFARLRGPGKLWLQSLPFSRLADRIFKAAQSSRRKEEGSVLDAFGIGRVIDGD